jgi:hypothetical protein
LKTDAVFVDSVHSGSYLLIVAHAQIALRDIFSRNALASLLTSRVTRAAD